MAFYIAFQFVDPAPPRAISIACGPQTGANCIFAKAYAKFMATEAVTLNNRATAGSVENIELLQVENEGVEIAFLQGGLKSLAQNAQLKSLGSLYFEPLWIFYRAGLDHPTGGAIGSASRPGQFAYAGIRVSTPVGH